MLRNKQKMKKEGGKRLLNNLLLIINQVQSIISMVKLVKERLFKTTRPSRMTKCMMEEKMKKRL